MGPVLLRNVILVLLVAQTTSIVLLMRYSRAGSRAVEDGPRYKPTAAVFLAEVLKLPFCIGMCAYVVGLGGLAHLIRKDVLGQADTLKCALPALAYTIQNNLLFVAISRLAAPTYQVAYQSKTVFTALFSLLLLQRRLQVSQWVAVVLLTLCTVLVSEVTSSQHGNLSLSSSDQLLGLAAVLGAAVLSGGSAVYLEKMLKQPSKAGLWQRNVQLGLFSMPLAAATMLWSDGEFVWAYGMTQGFGSVEWAIVLVNGAGGLLIAATMKYADSIVKCFASALAIISSTVLSAPLFGFSPSKWFVCGAGVAVCASVLYAWAPTTESLLAALRCKHWRVTRLYTAKNAHFPETESLIADKTKTDA
eukprot:CAMPEP_0119319514 /NCGR_PEP_ID=MMETSP1333-20130426/49583_1 /TAXON_ID=418940 /ORGANISM="Scyphosphaera apsteinii, Strain RCC1455" /LENGTH=359 /DNA_ID=CAMNT_0007325937 /DNA_START=191 /DNA_END=1270 /DNA_ORIENTATION=-